MTTICAVASVLWIYYPKFRALYALVVIVVAIGLIGADYHFLSDIIAGSLLGTITGWFAVALQEQAARRMPA
jgi:membrane-associated phospholipid phosphatase